MKGLGYFISMLSVLLLAIPAFESAKRDPRILICLVVGIIASLLGMLLRWVSSRRELKAKTEGGC